MSSYAKNTDRPATASVAQVEDPSGTDTHDPFDGNAGSLESGSGGSVDLSAVDQDIVVLNNHVVSYVGVADDDEGQQNVGWDSDLSTLVQKGDTTAGATSATWVDPFNAGTQVNISAA